MPGGSITLQRGLRISIARETVSRSGRKLSLGRSAVTGGLLISRKVKTSSTIDLALHLVELSHLRG